MSDFAEELAKLHHLRGADFSRQACLIAHRGEFHPLMGEVGMQVVKVIATSATLLMLPERLCCMDTRYLSCPIPEA